MNVAEISHPFKEMSVSTGASFSCARAQMRARGKEETQGPHGGLNERKKMKGAKR